jgi:hypothetical protein
MIDGFFQTDPRLFLPEREFGCALMDALYISPDDYTPAMVNSMYEALLSVAFIDKECTVLHWDEVLWSIHPSMRFKQKTAQDYVCKNGEREILKWYLWNVKENHFTVGDGLGNTAWDSMNRPDVMSMILSNGAKNANFVEKVIVKIS